MFSCLPGIGVDRQMFWYENCAKTPIHSNIINTHMPQYSQYSHILMQSNMNPLWIIYGLRCSNGSKAKQSIFFMWVGLKGQNELVSSLSLLTIKLGRESRLARVIIVGERKGGEGQMVIKKLLILSTLCCYIIINVKKKLQNERTDG